ncbi:MAG: acetyl-CoA carboxylase biotin carboxyl carrier protein [Candidatus Ratteibacteria bacterium]
MNPDELKVYADFMAEHGLIYLEVRKENFHLVLRKEGAKIEETPSSNGSDQTLSVQISQECEESLKPLQNLIYEEAPLVGTFYRAPSPHSSPFVEVGMSVSKGTTLCIIEAMKVMNEIKARNDGVIKEILVENATVVEFGEKLFVMEPPSL